MTMELTVSAGVVRLNMSRLDLAVLNHEGITLAAVVSEDGLGIKFEVQGPGELAGGVTEEADLQHRQRLPVATPDHGGSTYAAVLGRVQLLGPSLHAAESQSRSDTHMGVQLCARRC